MTHGATSPFQIPIKESMGMRRLGGRFLRIPISASAGSPAHGRSSSSHSSESRGWLGYAATLAHRGCGPSKIGSLRLDLASLRMSSDSTRRRSAGAWLRWAMRKCRRRRSSVLPLVLSDTAEPVGSDDCFATKAVTPVQPQPERRAGFSVTGSHLLPRSLRRK